VDGNEHVELLRKVAQTPNPAKQLPPALKRLHDQQMRAIRAEREACAQINEEEPHALRNQARA
jgi:hypothetical protein